METEHGNDGAVVDDAVSTDGQQGGEKSGEPLIMTPGDQAKDPGRRHDAE